MTAADHTISIAGRKIGADQPCYIIAEVSCNHEGSLQEALKIVEAAAAGGADAVKIQTYTPDTMTRDFKQKPTGTMWESIDLYSLYKKAHTPWEWHSPMQKRAQELGMAFFSSPFDETAVDFLVEQGAPALKIASFEVVDTKLLQKAAQTGLPILMSSGMTDYLELFEAVQTLRQHGCEQLAMFQCNSGYPSSFDDANLKTIPVMRKLFDVPVGLSDHIIFADTASLDRPLAHVSPLEAVRYGADMIEVHLTLNRDKARALNETNDGGFDWAFSRNPDEFAKMVSLIRRFEATGEVGYESELERECARRAHGVVRFDPTEKELNSRNLRPSLWITKPVTKGEALRFAAGTSDGNFDSLRPSGGLEIRFTDVVDGLLAERDLDPGTPVKWTDLEGVVAASATLQT
ncbi:MAG: N-acetylneuraminate synthase family protein [Vulcanimicrobiota bacterium]